MSELVGKTAGAPFRQENVLEQMKETIWSGWLDISDHCRDRMTERDASLFDLFKTIHTGEIVESHWDAKYRNRRYKVQGLDTSGGDRTIIAAMGQAKGVHFVTVFA